MWLLPDSAGVAGTVQEAETGSSSLLVVTGMACLPW